MTETDELKQQRVFLPLLLLVSGLCGISYEVLYGRLLGNIFGDQFLVSTAVLLTFMLGIGLGALHAHKLWSRLWLVYGCWRVAPFRENGRYLPPSRLVWCRNCSICGIRWYT